MTTPRENEHGSVVLFDGVCNLCNTTIEFIMRRDRGKRYRFASLQSDVGRRLVEGCGLNPDALSTVVLVEDTRCYTRSTAILRIMRHLEFPWNLAYAFRLLPRFFRDWGYGAVARNRYRWFGKRESCRTPTEDERERFLSE